MTNKEVAQEQDFVGLGKLGRHQWWHYWLGSLAIVLAVLAGNFISILLLIAAKGSQQLGFDEKTVSIRNSSSCFCL